jgi:hypothetical protein
MAPLSWVGSRHPRESEGGFVGGGLVGAVHMGGLVLGSGKFVIYSAGCGW